MHPGDQVGAYVQKTGFVSYNIQPDCGAQGLQLNLGKTADEPVVRATVLLPTSDASAEEVSITLGDWSETGGFSPRYCRSGGVSYPALSCTL